MFGPTGNRLLDKQQANTAAKPPAPKPEVGLVERTTFGVCSCAPDRSLAHRMAQVTCRNVRMADLPSWACNAEPDNTCCDIIVGHAGEEGRVKVQGVRWQATISEGLTPTLYYLPASFFAA